MTFIKKVMKSLKVDLTAGRQTWEEGKIQWDIFPGGYLLTLKFVIAMMPFNLRSALGVTNLQSHK